MGTLFTSISTAANFLDDRMPGWYKRINLDTLNQSDGSNCVLGQLFASEAVIGVRNGYEVGKIRLGIEIGNGHAFGMTGTGNWKQEILTRRSKDMNVCNLDALEAIPPYSAIKLANMESELRQKLKKIETLKKFKVDLDDYHREIKRSQDCINNTLEKIDQLNKELGLE